MWAVINEVRRHMTQLIRVTSTAEQRGNMTSVVTKPRQPGGGGRPCEAAISSSLYLSAVHKSCARLLLLSSAADLRSEDAPCDSRLFLPGLRTRHATPGLFLPAFDGAHGCWYENSVHTCCILAMLAAVREVGSGRTVRVLVPAVPVLVLSVRQSVSCCTIANT